MNCRYECRHPRELNLRWRYQKAKHFRESMGSKAWKAGKRVHGRHRHCNRDCVCRGADKRRAPHLAV
jgi:hypothetical protein